MSRIPKYQAWIPDEQKMIQVDGLSLLNGYVTSEHAQQICNINSVSLREFTGLLDKNGKEGYVDDLVEMFDRSLFGIAWDAYYACFRLKLVEGDEIIKVHAMDMLRFSRIVGNIYENPETIGVPHLELS